ncbi:hypothetical protein TNCT_527931 [Trichonephila clavata]|uniref:Uncharacterized protein n=1 Tax=Trichonephila clavata TaxID=2740835 RepID=A0A8X6HFI6_TRICU|nr:hypothetical protein TNCT_527931 [Trichonephila clavata]
MEKKTFIQCNTKSIATQFPYLPLKPFAFFTYSKSPQNGETTLLHSSQITHHPPRMLDKQILLCLARLETKVMISLLTSFRCTSYPHLGSLESKFLNREMPVSTLRFSIK